MSFVIAVFIGIIIVAGTTKLHSLADPWIHLAGGGAIRKSHFNAYVDVRGAFIGSNAIR